MPASATTASTTSTTLEWPSWSRDSPALWARLRIADLSEQQVRGANPNRDLVRAIRDTALGYGLMSDYTAFVAVDASHITDGDRGTTVFQAVPVPDGVRYETTVTP